MSGVRIPKEWLCSDCGQKCYGLHQTTWQIPDGTELPVCSNCRHRRAEGYPPLTQKQAFDALAQLEQWKQKWPRVTVTTYKGLWNVTVSNGGLSPYNTDSYTERALTLEDAVQRLVVLLEGRDHALLHGGGA